LLRLVPPKELRIAIDVTPLQTGHAYRGIGVYARMLVAGLLVAHPQEEWVLFSLPPPALDLREELSLGSQVRLVHIPGVPRRLVSLITAPPGLGRLRGVLRLASLFIAYQVLLPLALRRVRATLFHSTSVDVQPTVPYFTPCPTVVTLHDIVPLLFPEHYLRSRRDALIYKAMLRKARGTAHIITDTEASRADIVRRLRVPNSTVSAVPLGVKAQLPPATSSPGDHDQRPVQPYFIYAGTLDYVKNIDNLLAAFSRVVAESPSVKLVMIGHSAEDLGRHLNGDADTYAYIVHLGFVPREQVLPLFSGARGAVACYRYQGFGLPIAEAMAAGCPVITSNCGAMKEVAGGAALLVPPESPAEIARAIMSLERDDHLHAKLRRLGLARAQQLDWRTTVEATWQVYRNIVASDG
jgi:glycosyltransferase involved in cell wall biosynthesis